jgi:hypothetical protein
MRRLAQPKVVTSAAIAAALSAVFSLPRMLLWDARKMPVWYLEATVFFGGFVLWAFVFAWHTAYTQRPVFTFKIKPSLFTAATLAGVFLALTFHFLLDPPMRRVSPQDYPTDILHWVASTLFSLAFTQLFLLYAPFAWVMRLVRNELVATWMTVALGVVVLMMKIGSSSVSVPPLLIAELLLLRVAGTYLGIWFYLRGGILIVWWLELLVEARHLLGFLGFP